MMASKNYIIYKIVCDDLPDFIYVGSTCDFNYRKRKHKDACNCETHNQRHLKLYTTIKDNGGWENWRMIQIHQVPNITRREAEAVEEEYRVELKANLNMARAFVHPDDKAAVKKEYEQNYKMSESGIANRKARASIRYVCDCGKELRDKGKKNHEKSQFHLNYIKEQN